MYFKLREGVKDEKIFKKFKGIFCFTICLCIAVATFQVGVFAEESGVIVNSKLLQNNDGTVYGNGILSGLGDNGTPELNQLCYNKETGENRGYDNSQANDIVCSLILLHIESIRLFKI